MSAVKSLLNKPYIFSVVHLTSDVTFETLFCRFKDHPTLNDRYLLLHLLGRGGFSEVFKVSRFFFFLLCWRKGCSLVMAGLTSLSFPLCVILFSRLLI